MQAVHTITFAELETLIEQLPGTNGSALLDYVEIDPTAPVMRLRFKPTVDVVGLPADYDIDQRLQQAMQDLVPYNVAKGLDTSDANPEEEVLLPSHMLSNTKAVNALKVLVEGDSWCRLPLFLPFPRSIGTQLQTRSGLQVMNIAHWGDTLAGIRQRKEYLSAIDSFQPDYLVLSAGGNDLQQRLTHIIYPFHKDRPLNAYLNEQGHALLSSIHDGYVAFFKEVLARKPTLRVLVYGYEYPHPDEEGKYIVEPLATLYIPLELVSAVINPMMDLLNHSIAQAANLFPQVTYIDCRNTCHNQRWFDDMHLMTPGYSILTNLFVGQMH